MLVLRIPYPEVAIEPIDPGTVSPDAWYDPSDLSTLWQDTAGTAPVTAAAQAVARIDDKSGNGHHLTQATAANRPLYQVDGNGNHYLLFDGTDDYLVINAAIVGTLPFDRISAVRTVAWALSRRLFANGASDLKMRTATPSLCVDDGIGDVVTNSGLAVGVNGVVTERHIANASRLAINNGAYVTGNAGATAPANPFVIGARNTNGASPSNIRFYGCVVKAGALTDEQILGLRAWLADKAGVTL